MKTQLDPNDPVTMQLLAAVASGGEIYDTISVSSDTAGIRASPCKIAGYIVTASASGVITLYMNAANSGTPLVNARAVTANEVVTFPKPVTSPLGLSFDLVSGTATVLLLVL